MSIGKHIVEHSMLGVSKDDVVNVKDFGAVGDGGYPYTAGTNNNAALTAAFAAAAARSGNGIRAKVIIPPGIYEYTGSLTLNEHVDLDMRGAELVPRDKTNLVGLTIGTGASSGVAGTYEGLNVRAGWLYFQASGHRYDFDGYIGIRIVDMQACSFEINSIANFYIGLQLLPAGGGSFVAYNLFYLKNLIANKIAIDLRGNTGTSWVNENTFYGGNILSTSNMNNYGTVYGVRFSAEPLGYTGQNNNRFYSPSFQLGTILAWSSGMTLSHRQRVWVDIGGERYEFRVNTVGESQVVGTNAPNVTTVGATFIDNASVTWENMGLARRSPVYQDGAGTNNKIYGCRWETGFGPAVLSRSDGVFVGDNIGFETYTKQGIESWFESDVEIVTGSNTYRSGAQFELSRFVGTSSATKTFKSIHKKAITSAVGTIVPGFEHGSYLGVVADYSAELKILYDGLEFLNWPNTLGIWLDTNQNKSFSIEYNQPSNIAAEYGRTRVRAADRLKNFYTDHDTVHRVSSTTFNGANGNECFNGGPSNGTRSIIAGKNTDYIRIHFSGEPAGRTIITDLTIEALRTKISNGEQSSPIEVLYFNHNKYNENTRYSYGTPTVGFFERSGELIENADESDTLVSGWKVTTPGILALDWITATAYEVGEMVHEAGTIYRCVTSHTSGTFATDLSSGNWESVSTSLAVLEEISFNVTNSYTVAALPTGSTGGIIYVSNEVGGATLAFYDGTNWRRVSDRAIVS